MRVIDLKQTKFKQDELTKDTNTEAGKEATYKYMETKEANSRKPSSKE